MQSSAKTRLRVCVILRSRHGNRSYEIIGSFQTDSYYIEKRYKAGSQEAEYCVHGFQGDYCSRLALHELSSSSVSLRSFITTCRTRLQVKLPRSSYLHARCLWFTHRRCCSTMWIMIACLTVEFLTAAETLRHRGLKQCSSSGTRHIGFLYEKFAFAGGKQIQTSEHRGRHRIVLVFVGQVYQRLILLSCWTLAVCVLRLNVRCTGYVGR